MTEYEILDFIYESLPDPLPVGISLYENGPDGPEMYLNFNGECWRITAQPHPHPNGG